MVIKELTYDYKKILLVYKLDDKVIKETTCLELAHHYIKVGLISQYLKPNIFTLNDAKEIQKCVNKSEAFEKVIDFKNKKHTNIIKNIDISVLYNPKLTKLNKNFYTPVAEKYIEAVLIAALTIANPKKRNFKFNLKFAEHRIQFITGLIDVFNPSQFSFIYGLFRQAVTSCIKNNNTTEYEHVNIFLTKEYQELLQKITAELKASKTREELIDTIIKYFSLKESNSIIKNDVKTKNILMSGEIFKLNFHQPVTAVHFNLVQQSNSNKLRGIITSPSQMFVSYSDSYFTENGTPISKVTKILNGGKNDR